MPSLDDIFKPTDMASILSAALVERMSTEERSAAIAQAFEWMLTPTRKDNYSRDLGPTPLQSAFERALNKVVEDVAFEVIASDPKVRERVMSLIADTIESNLAENSAFRNAVADGVRKAMTGSHY